MIDDTKEEMVIKLIADTGTLFLGLRNGSVWVGLSTQRDRNGNPEVQIDLTDRQVKVGLSELAMLSEEMAEMCEEEDEDEDEDEEEEE